MKTENTYHYTFEDIQRYLSSGMTALEMHSMEKAALNDPFLADAIDGYRNAEKETTAMHLNEITAKLHGNNETAVINASPKKSNRWYYLAAASVIGFLALGTWLWIGFPNRENKDIVQAVPKTKIKIDSAKEANVVLDSLSTGNLTEQPRKANDIAVSKEPKPVQKEPAFVPSVVSKNHSDKENTKVQVPYKFENAEVATVMVPKADDRSITTANKAVLQRGAAPMLNKSNYYFTGKVTDEAGAPIPGVTVTSASNNSTVSNTDGYFTLPAYDSISKLSFDAVGYDKKTATLLAGRVSGISLSQNNHALNEVVIVGYGTREKAKLTGAKEYAKMDTLEAPESTPIPEGGWTNFYQNLNEGLRIDQTKANKTLQLQLILEKGVPVKFSILQTPDTVIARKAINIIKGGPKWKNAKQTTQAEVKLKVE